MIYHPYPALSLKGEGSFNQEGLRPSLFPLVGAIVMSSRLYRDLLVSSIAMQEITTGLRPS
jgi:hypothetical protein